MRKLLVVTALMIMESFAAKAQTASESIMKVLDKDQPVYTIELAYPYDVVEDALYKNFKDLVDSKGVESKGIRVYKSVVLPQISPNKMDYYTTVARKSKKEKDKSIVYLWVSLGNENFVSGAIDPVTAESAKNFLNNFMGTATQYNNTLVIKEQEEVVAKAEKKVQNAKEDISDLERKIADFQKKLEGAKKDLADREAALAKEKQQLADLKAKQ